MVILRHLVGSMMFPNGGCLFTLVDDVKRKVPVRENSLCSADGWVTSASTERAVLCAVPQLRALPGIAEESAIMAAIGNGKRTLGDPASLPRPRGRQGAIAAAGAPPNTRVMIGAGSPARDRSRSSSWRPRRRKSARRIASAPNNPTP